MQYKWVALSVTSVGTLMSGVDARIVLVGLPTIARELNAGVADVIWVSQAYLFASTLGLLLIGRTTDLVGRVKIYNYGFIVFTIGSAFASLSFSTSELIASRIVQGVGASMLLTNSAAILTDATPLNELGKILGISNIAYRTGSVMGLTLSGVILSIADWRALFYINIPIGIFGTLWAHKRLREISSKDASRGVDWPGFFTFAGGVGLLLLAITYLSYGLSSYFLGFTLLAAGAVLLIAFGFIETRKRSVGDDDSVSSTRPQPLLDFRIFRIREFAAGNLAMFMNSLAWSGIVILVSFYLQLVLDETPLQAGLSLLAFDATFIMLGPLSGRLSDRYGPRFFTFTGLALNSVAFFMFALTTSISTNPSVVLLALAVLGVGSGMFVSPNASSVMSSVPANRRGIASGVRMTMSNIGDTTSYGMAILLMTTGISYSTLNALVGGSIIQTTTLTVKQEFVTGFHLATLILASINTFALIPAWYSRKRRRTFGAPINEEKGIPELP